MVIDKGCIYCRIGGILKALSMRIILDVKMFEEEEYFLGISGRNIW